MKILAAAVVFALAGCASVPHHSLLTGDWGGPHVALHLETAGGKLEYDCASGTIGPVWVWNDGGFFVADGTHSPGHGGPIRVGEQTPAFPARYTGTVRGGRMTLQARVANGVLLGPFTLTRDAEPQLMRCL